MANGSPRSPATQIFPPKHVKIPRLSQSSHSNLTDPEHARTSNGFGLEIEINQRSTEGRTARNSDEASPTTPRSNWRGEGKSFLDESGSMRGSPIGSCNGSKNHDRAPQMRHANNLHLSSPFPSLSNSTHPNRQDSAYESIRGNEDEESTIHVDIQAGNIRARERVEILRGRVLRTRRGINESRQDLQLLREKLRDATARLMGAINELMARDNVQNVQSLAQLYEATRDAQDKLGPAEDKFDILEIRLNREEEELEQEEMHFYTHYNINLAAIPDSKLDVPLTPRVQPYHPNDVEFQNLDLENELVKEYLEKVTEAEHLKEEIEELENEQYGLNEELAFRTRYKLKLSEEKTKFMFEYTRVYKDLVEKLEHVEDDLYKLRDRCIDKRLFTASEHVYEPRDALVDEIYDSINDVLDRSSLRIAAENTPSYHPHEPDFKDKRDYVNTWMLGWVQDSPVESLRLRTCIILEYKRDGKEFEDGDWANLVLQWWDKDRAGERANEKHVLSTMDALAGESEGSLDVDLGDAERAEVEIMGSETGSYQTQTGDQVTWTTVDEEPQQIYSKQGLVIRNGISSISKAVQV